MITLQESLRGRGNDILRAESANLVVLGGPNPHHAENAELNGVLDLVPNSKYGLLLGLLMLRVYLFKEDRAH